MQSILKLLPILLCGVFYISSGFAQVNITSSNLPLIIINTGGKTILDDPKIIADMGIIWNGPGKRNNLTDPKNNYNGKIGIEYRGSSSQTFPKKGYGIETRASDLTDLNVSLLGMPEENDWVLYGPYSDKTMIRNALTYTLDASLGHWSPRCRFAELILNGTYQGVYVLIEKIKRDKNRVDIAKLTLTDNSGADLTGGYIIKIDKTTGSGGDGWNSDYSNAVGRTFYQYDYPKSDEITIEQATYAKSYIRNMEKSLYDGKFSGVGSYHDFLNDSSFIDFMIINELSKNVDGYRLSSYLYKDKNGLMNCGPVWDFNLAYGNADYYDGYLTSGFQYQAYLGNDLWQNPFWWNKLMSDQNFVSSLKKRWTTLRKKELSNERISFVVDSLVDLLSEAEYRNYQRWPILGTRIWPNYYLGYSYTSEVDWMNIWINKRLTFLDQQWPSEFTGVENQIASGSASVFPNPFNEQLNIQLSLDVTDNGYAEFYDSQGRLVRKLSIEILNGQIRFNFSGQNNLKSGIYVLRIIHGMEVLFSRKIVKLV